MYTFNSGLSTARLTTFGKARTDTSQRDFLKQAVHN
ncbi:MAG: hypothetical protein FD145_284 [Candidatus Saganbacteria bacterium]|uniref:Uncharacterized protein n=1 Tax=Candidatus Saganbacteria bacterium TaxID=2575572 RepID=A0A833L2A7_UNCSA|nr:MAG: hypothetical protein FD145_284 [Candidatus Saganbacteria bacterium]